jgi:hypothetical protein
MAKLRLTAETRSLYSNAIKCVGTESEPACFTAIVEFILKKTAEYSVKEAKVATYYGILSFANLSFVDEHSLKAIRANYKKYMEE